MVPVYNKTRRACLILVFALLGCASVGTVATASSCDTAFQARTNVVEVSIDKQTPAGSGIVLTFDGYIITAAHVLVGNILPPVPLTYFVRLAEDSAAAPLPWTPASLVKVDRDLDLAILKLDDFASSRPPLRSAPLEVLRIDSDTEVCMVGFGLRKDASGGIVRLGQSKVDTTFLPPETGYLIANTSALSGFSGGPLFDGRNLVGMTLRRRSAGGGSYVMPVRVLNGFVASEGIFLNREGVYTSGVTPQQLSAEVRGNRRSIEDNRRQLALVMRSIDWDIELIDEDPSDYRFILKADRAFPDQVLDGYFLVELTVHFDSAEFRSHIDSGERLHKAVVSAEITAGEIFIDGIENQLREIVARYLADGINLSATPISKFVVDWQITYEGWTRDLVSKELAVEYN